jgi:DNA polymerase-1
MRWMRRPRSQVFPAYQTGRQFDDELLDQLALLPGLVTACGFVNAKAAGYEADDFLAAAVRRQSAGASARWSQAATGMRSSSPPS